MWIKVLFISALLLGGESRAEGFMTTITSQLFVCSGEKKLQLDRWWTEPIAVKKDAYIFCGGNEATGKGAGVASAHCVQADSASCSVTPLASQMTTTRQALQPICLTKGLCYLFGGNTTEDTDHTRSIDLLEASTGRIKGTTASLPEPRLASASTPLNSHEMLITGGYGPKDETGRGPVLKTAVRLNPTTGKQTVIPMHEQRGGHTITKLRDGTFLVIGGTGSDPHGGELFDPRGNRFIPVSGKLKHGRKDHRTVLGSDGRVYIIGGSLKDVNPTAIEGYDPQKKIFFETELEISQGREDASVVYVKEFDLIIAVGGEIKGAQGEPESSAIDVIDLKNNKVLSAKLMTPRDEPSLIIHSIDRSAKKIRLLVMTGQRKEKGTEIALPAEEIEISLQ